MSILKEDDFIKACFNGLKNAQKDYEVWSGGSWLWEAPEYLSTVYIARALAETSSNKYITLENSAYEALDAADAIGRGKLHDAIRSNGRFDILLWWANGTPRAPIEVKNQVLNASRIEEDISRIIKVITRKSTINTFGFGAMVFYSSTKGKDGQDAEKKLLDFKTSLEEDIINIVEKLCIVGTDEIIYDINMSNINIVEQSAWTSFVIIFKAR